MDLLVEELKTKRAMLRSILKNIFNNVGVNVPYYDYSKLQEDDEKYQPARLHLKGYDISLARFNSDGITNYKNVFEYVFTTEEPKYANKNEGKIDLDNIFTKALTWLNKFFDLEVEPAKLITTGNLTDWGKRLYDCYMRLLRQLFTGNGDGKDEEINSEEIKAFLSDSIKERLLGKKDDASQIHTQVASTPCIPQAYKVDSKPSPSEIAAILGTKKPLDDLSIEQTTTKLGELPHKEELPQEAGYMYNYEDFNKDIDDANNALSRLPKKLDGLQLLILNHNIQFIRTNQIYFKECLSLEKKQHTLNVLKSTLERFFKEEQTQQEPPKPDPDTVTRQELWLYVKRKRSYPALKESIDELKRLIDHETQAKIPLTGTPEEKAMICLEKAGWYEGRNVDLSEVKAFYESGGITLPTGVENFLKEYYGLNDEWTLYEETDSGLQEAGRFIFKLYPMSYSPYDNDRYFDDEDYPAPLQYEVEAFAGNDLVYIGDIGYEHPAKVYLGETGKIYTQNFGFIQCYDSLLDVLLYRCSSICDTKFDTNSEKFKTAADLLLSNFKAADNWEYVTMRRE